MRSFFTLSLFLLFALVTGCSLITLPYDVTKGVINGTVCIVKGTYELTAGTAKVLYKIGEFTYEVVRAPADWALTHEEIGRIATVAGQRGNPAGKGEEFCLHGEREDLLPDVFRSSTELFRRRNGVMVWGGDYPEEWIHDRKRRGVQP